MSAVAGMVHDNEGVHLVLRSITMADAYNLPNGELFRPMTLVNL